MIRTLLLRSLGFLVFTSIAYAAWQPDPGPIRVKTEKWDKEIAALEMLDKTEQHPDDSILFIGSSSIRRWESIGEDVAPYHPVRRGYGGARFSDLAVFAERLIAPHKFRALVIFVGNDVSGSADDATSAQVATWFHYVASVARKHRPDAEIFCIEVTPTPSRWRAWPAIAEVNKALAAVCVADPKLHFIPTASAYLNRQGQPRAELFVEDMLHQNRLGYHVWAGIITSHLDSVLRPDLRR